MMARHVGTAGLSCPTLASKSVSAHTLRHTAAMRLLHAGVDTATIALWLGHEQVETTEIYVHADQTIKERALARTAPARHSARPLPPTDALRVPRAAFLSRSDYAEELAGVTSTTRTFFKRSA